MKHLSKFEELDYSTYTSAATKLFGHGQKARAEKVKSHAAEIEKKKIDQLSFDILVGDTKTFHDAKFQSVQINRERESKAILITFTSGNNNTHRVSATVNSDGTIVWRDNNKFANRKSVNNYQKAIKLLSEFHPEVIKMLDDMGLNASDLSVISRTFYI
jgi:hypothetical protein